MVIGDYTIGAASESKTIFPKNPRTGKTIRVVIPKALLTLTHNRAGKSVVFSLYKHQRQWYYRDSRHKTSCNRQHVLSEVARMLHGGNLVEANRTVSVSLDIVKC